MKRILILGGTQFIGRNLVELLLEQPQYDVTLFNRQRSNPSLFPQVARINGDRETNDIEKLKSTEWDAVIDLSCYHPGSLHQLLQLMRGRCGRYIFVSTLSVYDLKDSAGVVTESTPTLSCTDEQYHEPAITAENYGAKKAACERLLIEDAEHDVLILRPSVVYGAHDPTDRFYYWLYRCVKQMPLLLPDAGNDLITLTYVKDLARVILRSLELDVHNVCYNATTHPPVSLQQLILKMGATNGFASVSADRIGELNLMAGKHFPLWFGGPLAVSNDRLHADFEITFCTIEQSIAETSDYYNTINWPRPKVGLDDETIRQLLPHSGG